MPGELCYREASTYPAGLSPIAVAMGDLDKDTDIDIVVVDSASDEVLVLFNTGDEAFEAQDNFAVGDGPRDIVLLDFDGDLDLDVATVNLSGTVSILLNGGNGQLGSPTNYDVGAESGSIESSDFNGDGNTDLAVANSGDDTLSILFGNGDGTFNQQIKFDLEKQRDGGSADIETLDFDRDGDTDIVAIDDIGVELSVLLNNGRGELNSIVTLLNDGGVQTSVESGDLDGDGVSDILSGNGTDPSVATVLFNQGALTVRQSIYEVNLRPVDSALADVNVDGSLDAVFVHGWEQGVEHNIVTILLNGGGNLNFSNTVEIGGGAVSVGTADLNSDQVPDLITANQLSQSISVVLSNP